MCEVTITQATSELPMLVKKLQTGEESVVYIKQDGRTVAQLTLSEDNRQTESKVDVSKRIGIAKGKFKMPKDFDKCAYSSKNPIIRFLKGQHSKSYYITPAVRAIEKAIGEAEVSRCWWKFTLGRTDKEWAEWYFSTQHL